MSVTWKINGTAVDSLGLSHLRLERVNQGIDRLSFDDLAHDFAAGLSSSAGAPLLAVSLASAGSGYTAAPAVALVGGGGTGGVVTAALTATTVASLAVTAGGSLYTTTPTVSFSGGGGSGAAATVVLTTTGEVAGVIITDGGAGYLGDCTLSFSGGGGSGASGLAHVSAGAVVSTTLISGGSGYTSAPLCGVIGANAAFASPQASLSVQLKHYVSSLTLTAAGSGYTSAPTLSFSGGGGSGATATATLTATTVASLALTAVGSGYTAPPALVLSGGGGTGASGTATLDDAVVAFPLDQEIILTRVVASVPTIWFRGLIREIRRLGSARDERLGYVAYGPWWQLQELPFLQSFKTPDDPADTGSSLVDYLRGRAIIAQDASGAKITVKDFIEEVIAYAIAAGIGITGTVDASLDFTVPWDEVTDLSCAEVISRALQFAPDAVVWVDYSGAVPALNVSRRSALTALTMPLIDSGSGTFSGVVRDTIELRERPDLQKAGVYLLYLATNRENSAAWEVPTVDAFPVDAVPNRVGTLVRTIQLAGSVASSTQVEQRVAVDPLSSNLVYASNAWLTSGAQFTSLATWWKAHAPELDSSYVTVKGFAQCSRTGTSMGTGGQLDNELVAGAITDWMIDNAEIEQEEQTLTAYVAYEEARANDSTMKARHIKKFVARITATNAATRTYRHTEATSYTPAEAVPTGLAEAIFDAISVLQYDGRITLVETEPSLATLVGRVLHITGGPTQWETMAAVMQRAITDLATGTTEITLGPPRQLGPDDLVELFRVNRTRLPVTSHLVRTSGSTGNSANVQGLGVNFPRGAKASGIAASPGRYTSAITVAATVPTAAEISAAVLAAYTSNNIPVEGDIVSLTVSGTVRFMAIVTLNAIAADGWRRVAFTVSSVSYHAWVSQVGVYSP